MRPVIALACLGLATPVSAWEFSALPVCTLSHDAGAAAWEVTYDPDDRLYAIAITLAEGAWPEAPAFAIRFEGGRNLTISTDQLRLSDAGATLTVTDTGFGNVLDGLEFNATALATVGTAGVTASLDGAAPEVEAFRACTVGGLA